MFYIRINYVFDAEAESCCFYISYDQNATIKTAFIAIKHPVVCKAAVTVTRIFGGVLLSSFTFLVLRFPCGTEGFINK